MLRRLLPHPAPMKRQGKPVSRGFIWLLAAMGAAVVVLGVIGSVRGPGVDRTSFCVGGVVLLTAASSALPPGRERARTALSAGSFVVALLGLVAAFL